MIPALALAVLAAGAFRPRWARWAMLATALLLAIMLVGLVVSPNTAWTGGVGVLRGTRRGFSVGPGGLGPWASWDALGLLISIAALVLTARGAPCSSESCMAAAGIVGLSCFNDIRLVGMAWSLGLLSRYAARAYLRQHWSSIVCAVLAAGVGLSALMIGGMAPVLHAPHGHGGTLDLDGIGLVRHALSTPTLGRSVSLTTGIPLLCLVSSICLLTTTPPELAALGVAAGPLLLMKMHPIIELGLREEPAAFYTLTLVGVLLVIWAALRGPPRPLRDGLIALGGTCALLAARLPLEAVVWTITWATVASDRHLSLMGPLPIGVAASALMLARCMNGGSDVIRLSGGAAMAAGIALAWPGHALRGRDIVGTPVGLVCVALLLPPVARPLWVLVTGKLQPAAAPSFAAWGTILGGFVVALSLRAALRLSLDRLRTRMANGEHLVLGTLGAWVAPAVDTLAVIWVAAERFAWQGLTLWLPRRILIYGATCVAWFQTLIVPVLGSIPLHLIAVVGWLADRLSRAPRAIPVLIGLALALAWLL